MDSYQVTGNEIWTPQNNPIADMIGTDQYNIKIKNGITVPHNAQLTIQGITVELGPNAIVDVKTYPSTGTGHATSAPYGGYLKLDNAKLTAMRNCDNAQTIWKGMRVWGDATEMQTVLNTTTGQSKQGTLDMQNNSEISYANWAVTNVGPIVNTGLAANKPWNTSGGVILCKNSKFYNNVRAVGYGIYPVANMTSSIATITPYRSIFTKCTFLEDSGAPSFISFITGWAVNGVAIYGSSFTDNTGNNGTSYRSGVGGYDFGVKIDRYINVGSGTSTPCTFTNLNKGVELGNSNGNPATALVKNCLFDNNNTGAFITALPAPQVQVNTFNITANSNLPTKLGLYLATGSAYGVTYNSFAPKAGARFTVGATISNTGSDANVVGKNDYNTIWAANVSNYLNRSTDPQNIQGLQFLCNTNSGNVWDISATGSGNTAEGM